MAEVSTDILRTMIADGRHSDAVERANELAATGPPYVAAYARLQKIAALFNLGRFAEIPAALDDAYTVARDHDPAFLAEFHALAAGRAFLDGSLDRCATHIVLGDRALRDGAADSMEAVDAYGDLGYMNSLMGFYEHAIALLHESLVIAGRIGQFVPYFRRQDIELRQALYLDHCGQGEQATRILTSIVDEADELIATHGPDALRPILRVAVWYARVRLAATGPATGGPPPPAPAMVEAEAPENEAMVALGEVCRAITLGEPDRALDLLDRLDVRVELVGVGEPERLRSLALAAAGRYREAFLAVQASFAATSTTFDRARKLFLDSVAVRLDHEELHRTAARYADEAHTDTLTGLPNRRHFQRYAATEPLRTRAVIGVLDLDGLHSVNAEHGHLVGDEVLQRVAAVMSRSVRRGDLLARVGGDEFVLVMPGAVLADAERLGARVRADIAAEDWSSLVGATPVSVSVGWAELGPGEGLIEAFAEADRRMLAAKDGTR
ncbi:GGDEF domain-containing protein [Longispora sp. K20-0274]|uniref:GGDEF domain-containing protein n=1 Tax=Longispora sp. K20-0274 TaxID=3088255 RepID=UPI0039994AFC